MLYISRHVCGKVFYLVEEEDSKKACVQADSKDAALGPNQGEVQEDEVEVDINLLPEKERNKILNQRARDAKKAEVELRWYASSLTN
jgi:hypothetical protein